MERSCSPSTGSECEINPLTCHICLSAPANPVVTKCGHLFCWPCLNQWLGIRFRPCPVCRSTLKWSKLYVFPISGDGAARAVDGGDRINLNVSPAADQFPSRDKVLHALSVVERAHEHLLKEQTFRFFRTRAMCLNIVHAVTDIANPVQTRGRQNAVNLYRANWETAKRVIAERMKVATDIAGLQRKVIWSNQYLPDWWSSGTGL